MTRKEDAQSKLHALHELPKGTKAWELARDEAYAAFEYLVNQTRLRCFKHLPNGISPDDLMQAGRIALAACVADYKVDKKTEFITYAITCIRRSMTRCVKELSWSKTSRAAERSINQAYYGLANELGHPPTDSEVADRLGVSVEDYYKMALTCDDNRPEYLSQPYEVTDGGTATTTLGDMLCSGDDVYGKSLENHKASLIMECIEELTGELRDVALLMKDEYRIRDMSKILGISEVRIGALMNAVRKKVRGIVVAKGQSDLFDGRVRQKRPLAKNMPKVARHRIRPSRFLRLIYEAAPAIGVRLSPGIPRSG